MSVKVLLVQGSAYQRILFSNMLSSHKDIDVINVVRNGKEAFERILHNKPDVLVIDIGMPNLDSLNIFQDIIKNFSIPAIILISSDLKTEEIPLKALISKAFDLVIKPSGIWKEEIPKIKNEIITKVLLASKSKIGKEKDETELVNKESIRKHSQLIKI